MVNGHYYPSYYQGDAIPPSKTVSGSASPASELSAFDSSVGETNTGRNEPAGPTSFTLSVTLTYTDPSEGAGGAQVSTTESKTVQIQFVGRGGGGPTRGDGSPIDGGGGGPVTPPGGGGGKGGNGGGYHSCEKPFIPGVLTPNEIVDDRTPLALEPPTSVELVSENIASDGYKYGFDTYVTTTPPKRFSKKTVTTQLAGGNPESPVGGTLTDFVNPPDGQEIRLSQTGNPSYYGAPDGGTRTETTLSASEAVEYYDDCPNNEADTPATMSLQENLTEEYTTAALKTWVFDKAFDFKGQGYYRRESAVASLDLSTDQLSMSFQKTKYKWRVPEDDTLYPRPYKVIWVEVFTPEDPDPSDDQVPAKEYKMFSEDLSAGQTETQVKTIDPSGTSDKQGTWEVMQVEVTPKGSAETGFANPKDCWDHEKDWFDFQGVTSKSPGEAERNRVNIEVKFGGGGLPQGLKPKWTLEAAAGTLENADTVTPKHLPPAQPGQGKLTIEILDEDNHPIGVKFDRVLKIYKDHLERNRENFGVGTFCGAIDWPFNRFGVEVKMKEDWNCHGSMVHSYDGTGDRFISASAGLPPEMANWPLVGSVTIAESEKYGFDDQGNPGTDVQPGHFRAKFQTAGITLKHGDVLIYRRPLNNTIDHSQMVRTGSTTYGANNLDPRSGDNGAWDWAEMEAGLYHKFSRSVDNDGDPIDDEDQVFPAKIEVLRPPRDE